MVQMVLTVISFLSAWTSASFESTISPYCPSNDQLEGRHHPINHQFSGQSENWLDGHWFSLEKTAARTYGGPRPAAVRSWMHQDTATVAILATMLLFAKIEGLSQVGLNSSRTVLT